MNCVDIVIGTARGTQFRVFDYYTRDRSTPLFDEMYGGTQGITAAIGKEVDGITTIKFRKSLTSGKSNIATCIIIFIIIILISCRDTIFIIINIILFMFIIRYQIPFAFTA